MAHVYLFLLLTALEMFWTATVAYRVWCSPMLWEGGSWSLSIRYTDQDLEVSENTARFSVDVIGQRYARQETGQRNGQGYNVFYLYYYPANTLYIVQDDYCVTRPIHGNFSQHCVEMPDSHAVEYLKEYLGDYETGVWSSGVRAVKDQLEYFYSVDPEGSIPLNEQRHGLIDNVPAYTVTTYFNVTLGIQDPSVFTPPDNCIKVQDLVG